MGVTPSTGQRLLLVEVALRFVVSRIQTVHTVLIFDKCLKSFSWFYIRCITKLGGMSFGVAKDALQRRLAIFNIRRKSPFPSRFESTIAGFPVAQFHQLP